jgi:hypothetical protein
MGRLGHALVTLAIIVVVFATPSGAGAQEDCGNGKFCPAGYACIQGGVCGPFVDAAPGSIKLPNGLWCEPGFRKHAYADKCSPGSYTDCRDGMVCPQGATCREGGGCDGVRQTGPQCGNSKCSEGRVCSSGGCINPAYFKDCGNGVICTLASACGEPRGCMLVGPQRIPQQSTRR